MFWDIGVGILLGIFSNAYLGISLEMGLLWGIVFSLLPDVDMLGSLFPRVKKIVGEHRQRTHFPILYLFPVSVFWAALGWEWAMILGVGVYLHLIHDTFMIGSGIKWRWPFSEKAYLYFPQDHKHKHRRGHWFATYYLRPTLVSVPEYLLLFLSFIALYFYAF